MELSAELLRRIAEGELSAPPAPPSDVPEQRRTPRQRLDVRATLLPFSDRMAPKPLQVPLRDISRGGFGFLYHRLMPLGEPFGLVVPCESDRPTIVLCTIAYWQPLAPSFYAIGARFCQVLRHAESDLPLIFEDAVTGERHDVRRAS